MGVWYRINDGGGLAADFFWFLNMDAESRRRRGFSYKADYSIIYNFLSSSFLLIISF